MNTSPRRSSGKRIIHVVVTTLLLLAWAEPALAQKYAVQSDTEVIRQELLEFIALQEALVETVAQIQTVKPGVRPRISFQYESIASMSNDDLLAFAEIGVPLADVNVELRALISELDWTIENTKFTAATQNFAASSDSLLMQQPSRSYAGTAVPTAGASHMLYTCPDATAQPANPQYVDPLWEFLLPPGYCHQKDIIPDARNKDGTIKDTLEYRLSDVELYPILCFANIPPDAIVVVEVVYLFVAASTKLIEKACQQEGGGFNTSVLCAPLIVGIEILQGVLEEVRYCNTQRRGAELGTVYARLGETFVQGNAHYKAMGELNTLTNTATNELKTSVTKDVKNTSKEITDGLNAGFSGVAAQADAVDQQLAENSTKVESARSNSDIIKYKIWCDQQRGGLKPSDCP
jgi:hypothetical protein